MTHLKHTYSICIFLAFKFEFEKYHVVAQYQISNIVLFKYTSDYRIREYWEEFEDTKTTIKRHKSKKDRQYTGQEKNTNNNLQTAKDRATGISPIKTGCELRWSGKGMQFLLH